MLNIEKLQSAVNIAELLDKDQLLEIGKQVVRGFEIDDDSRSEWKSSVDQAMDIAKQVMSEKSFPWPKASNIKFPLITQASIDYAARTLPEVIQNEKVVKVNVIGTDKDDIKYKRADRISKYVSYDLINKSPDWVDGTDKLIQILPVLGTVFKKTYYNEIEKRNCSDLCVPDKIVVNYGVQSLESARRVTHLLTFYINDIIERQRRGLFLEDHSNGDSIDLSTLRPIEDVETDDADYPIEMLEQHCFLDLDEDGYKEPYIVTVHKESKQVFRIVHRFKDIEYNNKKKIVRIVPEQYFTDFHFIRSPDGGFYSMGFGTLLLPINKSINTLINQLIDSGTLNNTQGGIIGKGLRIKNGDLKFKMGVWQILDVASGEDIAKSIYPWPTKEPSQTLFQLLSLLMQVGRDLSSTTDVLMGKQPAQNVASSTYSQLVEQGTKIFIAINKRLYRSLKKEYQKLYRLYSKHLTQEEYVKVLDDPEADKDKDFNLDDLDIVPVADPTVSTETQRIYRAGIIQQLKTIDPREADKMLLQAMQLDSDLIERLLPQPDPEAPPPPEAQKIMAEIQKMQAEIGKISAEATLTAEQMRLEIEKFGSDKAFKDAQINESIARVWKMQKDALNNDQKLEIVGTKMVSEQGLKEANIVNQSEKDQADILVRLKELDAKLEEAKLKSKADERKQSSSDKTG